MDKIPEKFPSIYNHPQYKEINLRLYQKISYRAIADWLKKVTDCKEDCISASWIGNYARYIKAHGGFEQLLSSEDIQRVNVTLPELDQHAMNLMYEKLHKLEDGNFVQAFGMIMKYSRDINLNLNANVNANVSGNLIEEMKKKRRELDDIRSDSGNDPV